MSRVKLGICIPTYNEATNIEVVLTKLETVLKPIKDASVMVLVVDDSSPDGTAAIVKTTAERLARPNFKAEVLVRTKKDGFGKACVAGFTQLLAKKVDYILQMDADLSHNPAYIPAFISAAKDGRDFVVASRYIKGGDTPDWPLHRRLLSRYGNLYSRLILSRTVSDYTGGFNLYKASLIKKIELASLQSSGYGFLIELKFRALGYAKSVQQIPIIFNDRQHGKSKIPKSTLIKNIFLVPKIRLTAFFDK